MINSDFFLDYLRTLPEYLVYLMLGISAFVENIFPPIPGDTVTAFGAFLVAIGRLNLAGVFISTTTGSFLGFMTLFAVGGYLGRRFFIEKDYRLFKGKDIIKAEEWFRKYGYFIIMINRFLPGIRSVISIAAGISGLNRRKVILLSLVSSGVWNLVWIAMGFTLGNNWETVQANLSTLVAKYNVTIISLFVLFVLLIVISRRFIDKK